MNRQDAMTAERGPVPALYFLIGYPGTGKLTVARALATLLESEGETVRVVDNHWINNPIFGLIEQMASPRCRRPCGNG